MPLLRFRIGHSALAGTLFQSRASSHSWFKHQTLVRGAKPWSSSCCVHEHLFPYVAHQHMQWCSQSVSTLTCPVFPRVDAPNKLDGQFEIIGVAQPLILSTPWVYFSVFMTESQTNKAVALILERRRWGRIFQLGVPQCWQASVAITWQQLTSVQTSWNSSEYVDLIKNFNFCFHM